MKKSAPLITFRAGIAATLCLSIFLYPELRVSSAATATNTVADVKSESQLRSEASSYDAAMQAIAGVASMTFAKPEDLKRAVDVLNRARPGLKFHRSKFVLIGLSDSAFINAARRKFPNKQALETFSTQLAADPKLALTLEGASSLQSRIRQKIDQDAATLRRASERLRDAAARFKKAQAPKTPEPSEFKILKAGFSYTPRDTHAVAETNSLLALDPLSIVIIIAAVVGYAVIIYAGLKWYGPYIGIGTQEDKDQVADCQEATDARYNRCVDEASDLPSGLPFFLREVAQAACYADWLARQAACLTLIL